jgi:hypothetical protein
MPPSLPNWLSVLTFEPRLGDAPVDVLPTFSVRFNTTLNTDLVDTDPALAENIILVRMDTDAAAPVTYVGYSQADRILQFRPTADLAPGAFYQVTIRKELRNAQGRAMAADRVWTFQVDASPIGTVELLAPADSTAYASSPTLQWQGIEAVSGTVSYDLRLDNGWDWAGTPLWQTTLSAAASGASGIQSAAIGISLTENQVYYWQVRARTDTVTGDWTDAWAFYLGSTSQTSPSTRQSYETLAPFRLAELLPADGAANLSSWPIIRATFTQDVSGAGISSQVFQVWKETIDGQVAVSGAALVSGSLEVSGNVVEFTPAEDPIPNTRYTVLLTKALTSAAGETLGEDVSTYFTGHYTPLYGGVFAVRSLHGTCCTDTSTDEIYFQLWKASLDLHRILIQQDPAYDLRPASITFQQVLTYVPKVDTFGMVQVAEYTAAISILDRHYFDLLKKAGKRVALGVFEYQVSVELLAELRAKLKEMREQRDQLLATLMYAGVHPQVLRKSELWDSYLQDWDFSFRGRHQMSERDGVGPNGRYFNPDGRSSYHRWPGDWTTRGRF